MIELSNTKVKGFEAAIRGMRNPMNSWDKSDSLFEDRCVYHLGQKGCDPGWFDILNNIHPAEEVFDHYDDYPGDTLIGANDMSLMRKLANAGSDHSKYRRMIVVWVDILAPLYWWKEFDTYKVGTVANSCSTMHKIHSKEFTIDDFSHEHLLTRNDNLEGGKDLGNAWRPEDDPALAAVNAEGVLCYYSPLGFLSMTCDVLNRYRELYLQTKDKRYWWQMIQLLPSSYNQKRTVMLNYEVLSNIYHARRDHKLDCWHTFCDWIESLPESWIITGDCL